MSGGESDKPCDCVEKVDAKLAEHNTMLIVAGTVNGPLQPALWTEKRERRRDGKKPMRVLCKFCPFCGKKFGEAA